MKRILLACDQLHIDPPLRRSLGHLLKSCHIDVVYNGDQVFDELSQHAYDLIIIDFEIPGADSLELVESVQYIDPGVPVILMLQEQHQSIQDMARRFKAHPILCPFKPLSFLRLVDKLLHKQLNRYRRLAETLKNILEALCVQTSAPCAFLVEEAGDVLMAAGDKEQWPVAELGAVVVERVFVNPEVPSGSQTVVMPPSSPVTEVCSLYAVEIADNLCLTLLVSSPDHIDAPLFWPLIDAAAGEIRTALYSQMTGGGAPPGLQHHVIMLEPRPAFDPNPADGPQEPDTADEEWDQETAVNWGIISDHSNLLSRLQDFCQIE